MLHILLEVRAGATSNGRLPTVGNSNLYSLSQEPVSALGVMGSHSSRGLYIQLQIQNTVTQPQQLSFIYGIYQQTDYVGVDNSISVGSAYSAVKFLEKNITTFHQSLIWVPISLILNDVLCVISVLYYNYT